MVVGYCCYSFCFSYLISIGRHKVILSYHESRGVEEGHSIMPCHPQGRHMGQYHAQSRGRFQVLYVLYCDVTRRRGFQQLNCKGSHFLLIVQNDKRNIR